MKMPWVVDSHCHLDYEALAAELPQVLAHANDAGVGLMLAISTRVRDFPPLIKIATENPAVYCTVGTHPNKAIEEVDVTLEALIAHAQQPKVVGIGETGLDYHYDYSPRPVQEKLFRLHIAAARSTGLPLVIHAREADEDMIHILEEEMKLGVFKPLLHCFTASALLAKRGVELGCYISFSGILTYKTAANLREIAKDIPLDRLLVETDAPYLAPVPHRGQRNEPAFVVHTLAALADVKSHSPAEMAQITSDNFFRLFDKVPKPAWFAQQGGL